MSEFHEIIPGEYSNVEDVRVKFTTMIEVPVEQIYSEQEVINTIESLEQRKTDFCYQIDREIEVNEQMLSKIRAIDRTIFD
jgi:hypothetical protein